MRRTFLGVSFLAISVLLFKDKKFFGATSVIETIKQVQYDLFPLVDGIDIKKLDTISYLENIILKHSRITNNDKEFIRNGAKWLNEEAVKVYNQAYITLEKEKREDILQTISKTKWGDNWIYTIMGFLFEAIFSDPIYEVNNNEIARKWLDFKDGVPRSKKAFL